MSQSPPYSIYKLKSRRHYELQFHDENGKRHRVSTGCRNSREAHKWAAEFFAELRHLEDRTTAVDWQTFKKIALQHLITSGRKTHSLAAAFNKLDTIANRYPNDRR